MSLGTQEPDVTKVDKISWSWIQSAVLFCSRLFCARLVSSRSFSARQPVCPTCIVTAIRSYFSVSQPQSTTSLDSLAQPDRENYETPRSQKADISLELCSKLWLKLGEKTGVEATLNDREGGENLLPIIATNNQLNQCDEDCIVSFCRFSDFSVAKNKRTQVMKLFVIAFCQSSCWLCNLNSSRMPSSTLHVSQADHTIMRVYIHHTGRSSQKIMTVCSLHLGLCGARSTTDEIITSMTVILIWCHFGLEIRPLLIVSCHTNGTGCKLGFRFIGHELCSGWAFIGVRMSWEPLHLSSLVIEAWLYSAAEQAFWGTAQRCGSLKRGVLWKRFSGACNGVVYKLQKITHRCRANGLGVLVHWTKTREARQKAGFGRPMRKLKREISFPNQTRTQW